jgi:hypothetical protein
LPAAPDRLVLQGISGTGPHRCALINDKTFLPAEVAAVRVGESNVVVRCLEVRAHSALVQLEKTGEKRELFLGDK